MSDESDLINLYSTRILALAADIPCLGQLESPQGHVRVRSPLCGSTVTAEVVVQNGKIAAFAQNVKACALGQAAAAVVGAQAVGRTEAQIRTARTQLENMLKNNGPVPDAPFQDFEVLLPARDFRNRHASILLALQATLEAMEMAKASACA